MRWAFRLPCFLVLAALGGGPAAGVPGESAPETPATAPPAFDTPILRLIPPLEESGRARVHAFVTESAVDRVRFFVAGREVGSDRRAPFQVTVDLDPPGESELPGHGDRDGDRTLWAVAYDADGRILGEDVLPLDARRGASGLRIREVVPDPSGDAVQVEIDLVLPRDLELEALEVYRNRELAERLDQPPFRVRLPGPPPSPEDFVRALAVLSDGTTLEDARPLAPAGSGERLDVALVELVTVATDRHGEPVRGLGRERFRVLLDGRELPVQRFREAREVPLAVGLLVDSSSSMSPVMEVTRRAAARFLERTLRSGDRAFLMEVSTRPRVVHGLTGEPAHLEAAFAGIEVGGDTALFDAVVLGTVELAAVPGRRALVALTDGRDFGSHWGLRRCLRQARRAGTPVYFVSVGGLNRYRTHPDRNLRLEAFARETGGRLFRVTSTDELDRVYDRIEGELRSQYLLSVAADRVLSEEELARLEVRLEGRGLSVRSTARRAGLR